MVHVAQDLDTGIPRMSDTVLSEKDLPLGTLLPDAEYNQLLAMAIASRSSLAQLEPKAPIVSYSGPP